MDDKLFAEFEKSLGQMVDHAAGRATGYREVVKQVKAPRPVTKEDVVKIRTRLRVSQAAFAHLLNISVKTVQAWEQGTNVPNGSSLKLLAIARKNPKMLFVN